MKKIVFFLILILGNISFSHLGLPCSVNERKCTIRGYKINGEVLLEADKIYTLEIIEMVNKGIASAKIKFVGHADDTGSEEYNKKLSEIRAKNMSILFRELGLKKSIEIGEIIGMGEANPMDTNETVQGRYHNRRVEIFFEDMVYEKF